MGSFSLLKQCNGIPERSQNVILHNAAKFQKRVEIQVTYNGFSWAQLDGRNHAMLSFNIELIQPKTPILKDTQITFSFDCHPRNKECHIRQAEDRDCQNPQKRHRGVVKDSLPRSMYGRVIDRIITHHDQFQLAPDISVGPFGSFTLGALERNTEWTQKQERGWILNSRVLPPTAYNKFPVHTNARFEWKYNEYDREDFPRSIRVGVIVECPGIHPDRLPMTVSIDGSLGRWGGTWFSKRKDYEFLIPIPKELIYRDALLQQIERIFYQSDTMKVVRFKVECPETSQDDVTVNLVGQGDILGDWGKKQTFALTKVEDHGLTAVWQIDKLVNARQEFEYKFIKESNGGQMCSWEAGPNRKYSATDSQQPELSPPRWEGHEELYVL